MTDHDVVVVGAGAAGVGVGAALSHLAADVRLLDREGIGASFERWPDEMRFITPSFPSNGFGHPDLNAVAPGTSPAAGLDRQQLSGDAYAEYLRAVAERRDLDVDVGVTVTDVRPTAVGAPAGTERVAVDGGTDAKMQGVDAGATVDSSFTLETTDGTVTSRFVVWAGGQFGSPRTNVFPGAESCVHNASVGSWAEHVDAAADDEFLVIGGFESGIDAAVNLVERGCSVTVLDRGHPWALRHPDPSETLAPYTLQRLAAVRDSPRLRLIGGADVERVKQRADGGFDVVASPVEDDPFDELTDDADPNGSGTASAAEFDDHAFETVSVPTRPILATGFEPNFGPVDGLFPRADGLVELTDRDESPTTPGLFLSGPDVAHDGQLFCFIYKFRERFPVVAETIGNRLGIDTEPLGAYREAGMFLEDLSCCEPIDCTC